MTEPSLEDQIKDWLASHGYPFELRVAKAFRDAGWDVEHAQLYSDPETGKSREIDLVATVHAGSPELGLVTISWAIECKATTKPWIVFTSRQSPERIQASAVSLASGVPATGVMIKALELGNAVPTFTVPSRLGHGAVRAFSDNKSGDPTTAYSALLGATSAATALHRRKTSFWLRHATNTAVLAVYIPLVVIDGRLFELELDDQGADVLGEVSQSIVWSRSPGGDGESLLVNIITASALPHFAIQAARDAKAVAESALAEAPEIWRKFQGSQFIQAYESPAT